MLPASENSYESKGTVTQAPSNRKCVELKTLRNPLSPFEWGEDIAEVRTLSATMGGTMIVCVAMYEYGLRLDNKGTWVPAPWLCDIVLYAAPSPTCVAMFVDGERARPQARGIWRRHGEDGEHLPEGRQSEGRGDSPPQRGACGACLHKGVLCVYLSKGVVSVCLTSLYEV